jgi:hypothetical protein
MYTHGMSLEPQSDDIQCLATQFRRGVLHNGNNYVHAHQTRIDLLKIVVKSPLARRDFRARRSRASHFRQPQESTFWACLAALSTKD